MVIVRNATFGDSVAFAELMLISAPYFPILFGERIKTVLQDLFCRRCDLFSFEHVHFAEVNQEKVGMILGYDWKIKSVENLRTGFLLFRKAGVSLLYKTKLLMRFSTTVGQLHKGEYYISNIAIYPKYRGRGIGKTLMLAAEQEAKIAGAERIVLDVEKENTSAISLYENIGYEIIGKFSLPLQKDKILHFYRMIKEIREDNFA